MAKKSVLAVSMAFLLILGTLAGCGKSVREGSAGAENTTENPAHSSGKGRFIESECTFPKEIDRICTVKKTEGGTLMAVGVNEKTSAYYILSSKDMGENWGAAPVKGLTEDYYPRIAISPDGRAVFMPYTANGKVKLRIADSEGKTEEISVHLPKAKETENHIWQAEYDNKGNLICLDTEKNLLKIDTESQECESPFDTEGTGINYFGIVGTKCLAVYDSGIYAFDTETGKTLEAEEALSDLVKKNSDLAQNWSDSGVPMVFTGGSGDNSLLYVNRQGIFQLAEGGNVIEQLADDSLLSIGNQNVSFYAAAVMDVDNIFVCASDERGTKLFHYEYDPGASAMPGKEITVYALDESNVLRQAISIFRKKYPDIYVNLETGVSGEDSVTVEDALSVLNTNIMAGKGPDVLILDGMPADSYIEKGILTDISDVVKEIEKEDGLFENICTDSERDGHIYAMPASFLIPMAEGDEETLEAAGDLGSLADRAEKLRKENPSKQVMQAHKGVRGLLRELYYADSATWQKEDGTLDEALVTNFLTQAKRLYDVDQYDTKEKGRSLDTDGTFLGEKMSTLNNEQMISGECAVGLGTVGGLDTYQRLRSAEEQTKTSNTILNKKKICSYVPYLLAGVTAEGDTEAGKEFVKILLGREAGALMDATPVNRAAFQEQIKDTDKAAAQGVSIGFNAAGSDEVYGFSYVKLRQNDIDKITEEIESLEASSLTDRVIQDLVLEQGEKYISGEQTLEEAVGAITRKVGLYLSE